MSTVYETLEVMGNMTIVCQHTSNVTTQAVYRLRNPLNYPTSLLVFQLSIISLVSQFINLCLKPLGQSSIVSQIVGGILFGPSMLGHQKVFSENVFPLRGTMILETVAAFGIMFFLFEIGVKMDTATMLKPEPKAMAIGISVYFFTFTLPVILSIVLTKCLPLNQSLADALPLIAGSQSLTAFPVIAFLLTELKILNTDIGRLALSSTMFCDVIGIILTSIVLTVLQNKGHNFLTAIWALLSIFALVGAIIFVFRPMILWILSHTPEGKSVDEACIFTIFVLVLVSGFLSELIGQHYVLGPLILGLAVPDGPPLGAALVEKLNSLATGLLYPTFLAVSGLQTNVFKISLSAFWVVGLIVLFSCLVKIGAVILVAVYHKMPLHEAFVLGLILNAKGINELLVYNLWKQNQVLMDEEFSVSVISVVAVTAIITPLIKILYNPADQYISTKRHTIQHAKRDADFRILVCIHNHENVPTIMNLLEVANPTEENPVTVIAMVLVELIGRSTPLLVSHQHQRTLQTSTSSVGQTVNALRRYKLRHEGYATVQSFTSISHFETIHEDICRVAFEKRVLFVIVPFHKQWAIDGSVGSVNRQIQNMNLNVLERAPCSVGILIDRGVVSGSVSILTNQSFFHVAVLFIAGPDDAEALAYGARMGKYERANVTVIRFLLFGCENSKERKRDSDLIDEYRQSNMGNPRFEYVEEVVRDGVGLASAISGMTNCFDLLLVGRYHPESALLTGLGEWSECPELGVIGDMLASPDFGSTGSVLVVQQQRIGANALTHSRQPALFDKEPLIHDVPEHDAGKLLRDQSWTISIERN